MAEQPWDGKTNRREITHIETQLQLIIVRLDSITGAFPVVDGKVDTEGHRQYHEAMIEAAKEQAAFWREMKLDLAKKGAWGLLLMLVGFLVVGLSMKLGIGAGAGGIK